MSNALTIKMEDIRKTPALQIADMEAVQNRFVTLLERVHNLPPQVAEGKLHAEVYHYKKIISSNEMLKKADPLSIYGVFLDAAVNGLSFDPSQKMVYVIPENVNVGTKEKPVWQTRAKLEIQPSGELAIRQQKGQIAYADDVVIVYEGDKFECFIENGKKHVNYALNVNHGDKIIGSFMHIKRVDGSDDYVWLLKEDINRLAGYSARKNKGTANALYTSNNGQIDSGFLKAKTIKHAFKSYPKVELAGKFSAIAPDPEESDENIYGFDVDQDGVVIENNTHQSQPEVNHFAEPVSEPQAVIVGEDDDTF